MLDLTKVNKLYELKWFDGTILHIKRPNQSTLERVIGLADLGEKEQVSAIYGVCKDILNNNTDGKIISAEEVEEIDISIVQLIIEDYIGGVVSEMEE